MAADKMLRIAGRGTDGLAKAVRTDNSGNVQVKPMGSVVREQELLVTYDAAQMAAGRGGTGYQYQDVILKGEANAFMVRSYLKDIDGLPLDAEIRLYVGPSKFLIKHITNVENVVDDAFSWTTIPNLQFGYFIIDQNTEGWEYINSTPISDCRVCIRHKGTKAPASGGIEIYRLSL